MNARVLMIQGSSSAVGKSLLVAALCRRFAQHGIRVAPFKAQNMSNNAAVCADGAEIGRSQAVQAAASGLEPTAEMNPILLKPEGNARSQVIAMGRPWGRLTAGAYGQNQAALWPLVTAALDRLRSHYELVVIEGAGSPAELNLQAGDMVNMAVTRYAQAPVLLVGDIDRGGIFAQLLGTLWLLAPEQRALVRGLVVNKFRGDLDLFADGVHILEARSAVPVLGVIPFLPNVRIPEEDAAILDAPGESGATRKSAIDLAIIRLPHMANFDDFSPLADEAGVGIRYVSSGATLGQPQAVILPGTKSTIADLVWLREQGLDAAIQDLATTGTAVVGICGGYQMLGRRIQDPHRVESYQTDIAGMDLLPINTVFTPTKTTYQSEARILPGPDWLTRLQGYTVQGYEIHLGHTASQQPWLELARRGQAPAGIPDGAVNTTGRVWGCYLHGLFGDETFRRAWLASLGWCQPAASTPAVTGLSARLDALAAHVAAHLDMPRLKAIIWDRA
jgi:adenosylcobyric acid synthase